MQHLRRKNVKKFRTTIYAYYKKYRRTLPWRQTTDPYSIFISEVMLQQTQTERVIKKYQLFIDTFPDFLSLARATTREVFTLWQGMGYNRRALALHLSAKIIVEKYKGLLPSEPKLLDELPGIGPATSASISTFASNKPTVFIETNIRTVFIYFFFRYAYNIKDTDILNLVEQTLDIKNPREWYYALMDYGVMLKKKYGNLNVRSAHYTKQTPFLESNRRIRGLIMKTLLTVPLLSEDQLAEKISIAKDKVVYNVRQLEKEQFLMRDGNNVRIKSD